jgi:glycosyltransferase involved in cell wall biosynthesis
MAGTPLAESWVRRLGVGASVRLLPMLVRSEMAGLFRLATASVSPTTHDGTPNTLLEAMACGALPVAGDIPSVREWITHGVNGLLVEPDDHELMASAIIRALTDQPLRARAAALNHEAIAARADYDTTMPKAEAFYEDVVTSARQRSPSAGL